VGTFIKLINVHAKIILRVLKILVKTKHHLNQVVAIEYAKEVLPMISDVLYHEN